MRFILHQNLVYDVINSFFEKVMQWGPPLGIAFFAVVLFIKLNFGGMSFKKKSTSHGSAHFATRGEIKHLLHKTKEPIPSGETIIGFYPEIWPLNYKYLVLKRDLATRHILVLGPSGSGKSWAIFLPNCHVNNGSFIATDPKSELWMNTSGLQSNPLRFAPRDPDASAPFNFVPICRDIEAAEQVVISVVYARGIEQGDRFWTNGERQLLAALLNHVAHSEVPTPAHVYELLSAGAEVLAQELSNSKVKSVRRLSRNYLEGDFKIRTGIAQGLKGKMKWLEGEKVRRFTSSTAGSFEFGSLRRKATQIYWCLSEDDVTELQELTAIFFNLAMKALKQAEGTVPITLIFDEFANIGKLIGFEKDITLVRGRDIAIIAGLQSISQLETLYGKSEAETIFANFNNKVILNGLEYRTAEEISRLLGEYTHTEKRVSYSKSGGFLSGRTTTTESYHPHARRLLTADEIRRYDSKKLILVSTNLPPVCLGRLIYNAGQRRAKAGKCGKEIPTPDYEYRIVAPPARPKVQEEPPPLPE
jgi:type IV secretion system protein VirD4